MKRFLLLSFATAGCFLNAQTIGNSPYAAFGIGDVKYDNTLDISSMGGISTAYINDFNNSFNFKNPAANGNLDLTSFKIEGTNENNFYKSDYNSVKATKHSTYLSNVSMAFPLSRKLKFGIGFQPYSTKAYNMLVKSPVAGSPDVFQANRFNGTGSLSTLQGAISWNLSNSFALGLRTNLMFGELHDLEEITFNNTELINGFESINKVNAVSLTAGATYQKKFENDRKFTLGGTYTFGSSGKMKTTFQNSTYYYAGDEKQNESVIATKTSELKNMIPMEGSFGLGYGHEGRWFVSAQGDYRKGENFEYYGQPFQYQDSYRVAAGGWYLPNYNNFRNYFSRVIYRFGAYYEKGNLNVQATKTSPYTSIDKFAVSYGMTLPFANNNINRMSSLDLGIEAGKRGTLQNNLINQTFVNFKIGINFADKWFQKRQYD